jgi:hypothetical protein
MLREWTLWVKRVRKSVGALRYLVVAEAHADGFPHLHALVHEVDRAIRWRDLVPEWRMGFMHARLVRDADAAASYVTKYVTKALYFKYRIRASQHYGRIAMREVTRGDAEALMHMDAARSLPEGYSSGCEKV